MKEYWCVCFKGVYSLSELCLAGNVYDLLEDVTSLVVFCLVPESDDPSDIISNKWFEENEDKDLDEISILLFAIRTRSCSLIP